MDKKEDALYQTITNIYITETSDDDPAHHDPDCVGLWLICGNVAPISWGIFDIGVPCPGCSLRLNEGRRAGIDSMSEAT